MNSLKDKKVVFLGDSITCAVGASCPEKGYVALFEKNTGAHAVNLGVSGTRYAVQRKPTTWNPSFDRHFLTRVGEIPQDADIIVVFGGSNDFGHGDAPFGVFGDKKSDTFCGAVYELYETLCKKFPAVPVVAVTPLHRTGENDVGRNEYGAPRHHTLSDYAEIIRMTAEVFSLPVLDLYKNFGVAPQIEEMRALFMPDGLHPSDAGHRRLAQKMACFLKDIAAL